MTKAFYYIDPILGKIKFQKSHSLREFKFLEHNCKYNENVGLYKWSSISKPFWKKWQNFAPLKRVVLPGTHPLEQIFGFSAVKDISALEYPVYVIFFRPYYSVKVEINVREQLRSSFPVDSRAIMFYE